MRRYIFHTIIFTLIIICSWSADALEPEIGEKAPEISVLSGLDKPITLAALKGKIVVMFYDSRKTVTRNGELRKELNKYYDLLPDSRKSEVFKLSIIDCSEAFFPIDMIWKQKLNEASEQKKMTIYGDWSGETAKEYNFNLNDSNFVIVDKDGIIRFISRKEITDQNQIILILHLLNDII